MKYTYYPGCSLHAGGIGYDKSMQAVFAKLDAELVELDDWNCCGATTYTSVRKTVAYSISARNLALAEGAGDDIVAPCSACYYALNKTRSRMAEVPVLRDEVGAALAEAGLATDLSVEVRHPLEVLLNDVGIKRLVELQTHSLGGFRPACYYGCQIVRPHGAVDEDPELPMSMERLFTALGAEPVDYPPKVRCCGGMLVATFGEIAEQLCTELVGWAVEREANCIVAVCPLCQINLDMLSLNGSLDGPPMPVLYFTQLIGLALGCSPRELGLEHSLVPVEIPAPKLETV
jgi:heterodisulfide reductase subunit B